MSAAFIIDCSMAMSWCFADEATEATLRVQDRLASESVLVPSLWFLEVANVLAMAEKKKRIKAEQSAEFVKLLGAFEIEVDSEGPGRAFGSLMLLCREHGLTVYDAVYVDLAVRRRLAIATLDEEIRVAAGKVGVEVLGAGK